MQIQELKDNCQLPIYNSVVPTLYYVVYFLSLKGQIVYIGKSSVQGYARRVYAHAKNKDFDRVDVMPVSNTEAEALEVERGLISVYRPKYNVVYSSVNLKWILDLSKKISAAPTNMPVWRLDGKGLLIRLIFGFGLAYSYATQNFVISFFSIFAFVLLYAMSAFYLYVKHRVQPDKA